MNSPPWHVIDGAGVGACDGAGVGAVVLTSTESTETASHETVETVVVSNERTENVIGLVLLASVPVLVWIFRLTGAVLTDIRHHTADHASSTDTDRR